LALAARHASRRIVRVAERALGRLTPLVATRRGDRILVLARRTSERDRNHGRHPARPTWLRPMEHGETLAQKGSRGIGESAKSSPPRSAHARRTRRY
jgi:hypothetical protein